MRDDFSANIKGTLAKRVGYKCSNPNCRKMTIGPNEDATKSTNVGVAAHIEAAAGGGARYRAAQSSEERSAISNGIWLCQTCAKLIDSDETKYTVELLNKWKKLSEEAASLEIENPPQTTSQDVYITAINPVGSQVAHTIFNQGVMQRKLNPLLSEEFIDRAKQLPSANYTITISNPDSEKEVFAEELDKVLMAAGWKKPGTGHGFARETGSPRRPGVSVQIKEPNDANKLLSALITQSGLKFTGFQRPDYKDEVTIYIGTNQ